MSPTHRDSRLLQRSHKAAKKGRKAAASVFSVENNKENKYDAHKIMTERQRK